MGASEDPESPASHVLQEHSAPVASHPVEEDEAEFVLVDEHIEVIHAPGIGQSDAAPSMEPQ